ncbi:hypothetical protein KEM55_000711, partial [Ascosphaera atra]
MPESTGMTTAQFVGYVIFMAVSMPVIWIRPHKLEFMFIVSATIVMIFLFALLIWSLSTMGSDGF